MYASYASPQSTMSLACAASSRPPGDGSSSSTSCANVCEPSCQSCAQKNAWRDEKTRPRVVLTPVCDGPLRGGPEVVDLHAELVTRLHHVLAEQRVGPLGEHPDVEPCVTLSRVRELCVLGREPLGGVLAKQLVQLEAADAGSPHE